MSKSTWVRVGLGIAAISTGFIALWPSDLSKIDPEKGLAFLTAFAAWVFSEFYSSDSDSKKIRPSATAHDVWVVQRIRSLVTDEDIRFLEQHDFATSWWRNDIKGLMNLSYELGQTALQLEDANLAKGKNELQENLENFIRKLSSNCHTIGVRPLYTLLSDEERTNDHWDESTQKIIDDVNTFADQTAETFRSFLQIANSKNILLVPPCMETGDIGA
jgi:hypothetical protein